MIPDSDDIARHCKGSWIQEDGRVSSNAFKLRPNESYLSVSWLDFWGKESSEENLEETRKAFKRKGFELRKSARFAVAQVGVMCDAVATESQGKTIEVLHEPDVPHDESHSGIYNTASIEALEEAVVAEIIAAVITPDQIFPAIE
ncbi:MAG: hypothetical protein D6694_04870 [Gammaproteobacteria bacterium]|nr:MAG: hypothetical protein D6694_04870 [Gammaproteobacteria bacterium]